MKLTLQTVVAIGTSAWLLVASGHDSPAMLTYASDVLGVPGAPVTLSVMVEEASEGADPRQPATGDTVEFFLYSSDGQRLGNALPIGTVQTNDEGRATLIWNPVVWLGSAQVFEVGARIGRGQKTASETQMKVVVPPADRPLLLVKLDASRSASTSPDAPATVAKPPGVSGSTVLAALAEQHQLVYLTGVEGRRVLMFKAWMQRRGLPTGPLLLLADEAALSNPDERLTKRVGELVRANPRIAIGIGATAADAQAFVTNGLAAVIVPLDPESVGELPEGTFATSNWTKAYAHVRLCEMSSELLHSFDQGGEQAREALVQLNLLGRAGVPCVDRLREVPELRLAAIYVSDRLRGADSFWATVDLSSSEAVRDSLLAAWRFGEQGMIDQLYAAALESRQNPTPAFVRWELVGESRELDAAGVVYTIRLTGEDGRSSSYEITCFQQPDSTWRIRTINPL